MRLHEDPPPAPPSGVDTFPFLQQLVSVIREEIVEEQRGRHGLSQINPAATAAGGAGAGHEGDGGGGGEAAIETILMKASVGRWKDGGNREVLAFLFFLCVYVFFFFWKGMCLAVGAVALSLPRRCVLSFNAFG